MVLVYGNASATRLKKLQVMQNKSLKAIFRLPSLFSTKELFAKENHLVLPISALRECQIVLFMYKTLNVFPVLSNLEFGFIGHKYGTRSCHKLNI